MPFRHAHWWIVAMLALSALAFWPGYLSVLPTSPWAWHLHGITATLWLVMLALQSWTATTRRFPAHRAIGLASLGLFAAFTAGGVAVIHTMAAATPESAFYRMHGPALGVVDIVATGTVAWLYYRALVERRQVQRHARYMIATPLMLVSPALGRVLTHHVPGFQITGPDDLARFAYGVHAGDIVAATIALLLYRAAPRFGLPFLVVAVAAILPSIGFAVAGRFAPWRDAFLAFGRLPAVPVVLAGFALGAAIAWAGWTAGKRPMRKVATAGA